MIDLNISHYIDQLQLRVSQPPTEEPSSFLNRLWQTKIFKYGGSTDYFRFPSKILKTLAKIAQLKIGQDLLNDLIDQSPKEPLELEESQDKNSFSKIENKVQFNPNPFRLWKDSENNFFIMPFKVSFVHELFHYKHWLENPTVYNKSFFNSESILTLLLTPKLDDPEEQLAICGIDCFKNNGAVVDLCENHFRLAWNLPLRFTHRGITSPKKLIEKDIPIDSEKFSAFFTHYWKKLPENCYRKEALLVNIENPTPHQKELVNSILPYVKVHNLAQISLEKAEKLKTYELWDFQI